MSNMASRLYLRTTQRLSSVHYRRFSIAPTLWSSAASEPKISVIVDQIARLNLLETANLIDQLKVKLNIQEVAMPMAAGPAAGAAAPAVAEEKPAEKTSFKVKLEKIDPASKAKIIKEIKGIMPGSNLVEAKKFVESAPKTIKDNVPKEEAEKIKKTLEALGATVLLE